MLIDLRDLRVKYEMDITGIVHVGAHLGEEAEVYDEMGVPQVLWIEGNPDLMAPLEQHLGRFDAQTAVRALISNEHGVELSFNIANNGQSSSILKFGTHRRLAPGIRFIETKRLRSTTLDRLLSELDFWRFNMLNLDLQGAELLCLQGGTKALQQVEYVYTEVNENHLYKKCALIGELDEFLADFDRVETVMTPGEWGDALYVRC